ncbi:ABC transporter permease [Paenibacillus gorillae]|uniref:ABC transporter permease n=1 Tax=Paenibacillus gorillae TaxID=1243662 RepID=UPI0004AEB93C|nr:ABC transporter permease [Paenibacillus gorillae]
MLHEIIQYIADNQERFMEESRVHLVLSLSAFMIGIVLCVPLGILCAKKAKFAAPIMNLFNTLRVIPSLAVLVAIMPFLGTGFTPSLVALTLLACPPILIHTYLGFRNIDSAILEAASGMGMGEARIMRRIELPLALPLIITGAKTSAVQVTASATLAAFIGGGGLGTFIINGLSINDFAIVLAGAIPITIFAVGIEIVLSVVEKWSAWPK